jgi:hypothetical protein
MGMLLDMVNKTYKRHSRNFKTPKIKNTRRQKQINELIGAQNKHQSEKQLERYMN